MAICLCHCGSSRSALPLEPRTQVWDGNLMILDNFRLKLTAIFEPAPEGGYNCHFQDWPEIFSEGETVKANLPGALTQIVEHYPEKARKNSALGAMREKF